MSQIFALEEENQDKMKNKTISANVDNIRNEMNQEMSSHEAQLLKQHTEVALKEELMESQDRSIVDLKQKLHQLEQDLLSSQQESQEVTQDQLSAQWVNEMNEIWGHYFLGDVRVRPEHTNSNNQYKITVESGKKGPFYVNVKVFDLRNCKITLVEGLHLETLSKIKSMRASMRIGRIGLFISDIIEREKRT